MTYIDNGSPWWHMLLIAVAGGIVAVLVVDGWAWLIERRAGDRDVAIEDAANDTPAPLHGTWTPPLQWAANGRHVHRHDCPRMTVSAPIKVWSEDGAYHWSQERNLSGCLRCRPFDKPERVEVTG